MSKHNHNQGNASDSGGAHDPKAAQGGAGDPRRSPDGPRFPSGEAREKPPEKSPENTVGNGEKAQEGHVPEASAEKKEALEAESADRELKFAELTRDLEAKLAELNDQYLRKAADFENFRKRTIREKQELTEFANQNLLLDLLPIIDDFERAIKSAQSSPAAQSSRDFASFYDGIVMIEKRLSVELENKWGLKRFDSEGQPFDPNRHEALQMEKAAGLAEPVVKEDYLKGYLLKEKVIRCAKVKVLMPDGESPASPAEA